MELKDTSAHDGCPAWAARLITRLKVLEIKLGNIAPEGGQWRDADLASLVTRLEVNAEAARFDESVVEALFREVSQTLAHEGYQDSEIANFINNRLRGMSRLPYCNSTEVRAAIDS